MPFHTFVIVIVAVIVIVIVSLCEMCLPGWSVERPSDRHAVSPVISNREQWTDSLYSRLTSAENTLRFKMGQSRFY